MGYRNLRRILISASVVFLVGCQTAPTKATVGHRAQAQLFERLLAWIPGQYGDGIMSRNGRRRAHFRKISLVNVDGATGKFFLFQDFFDAAGKRLIQQEIVALSQNPQGEIGQQLFVIDQSTPPGKRVFQSSDLEELADCSSDWVYADFRFVGSTKGKNCPGSGPDTYSIRRLEIDDYGLREQTTQHDKKTDRYVAHSVEQHLRRDKTYMGRVSLADPEDLSKWSHSVLADISDSGQYLRLRTGDGTESNYAIKVETVSRGSVESLQLRIRNVETGVWLGTSLAPTGVKSLGWENDQVKVGLLRPKR